MPSCLRCGLGLLAIAACSAPAPMSSRPHDGGATGALFDAAPPVADARPPADAAPPGPDSAPPCGRNVTYFDRYLEVAGPLARDATHVYWATTQVGLESDPGYAVWRAPLAGGAPQPVAFRAAATPSRNDLRIAVAGDDVYLAAAGVGLLAAPKEGGELTMVAADRIESLAAGDASVYFTRVASTTIERVSAADRSVDTFLDTGTTDVADLALAGDAVVWNEGAALRRAPVSGGAPVDVGTATSENLAGVAVAGDAIIFGTDPVAAPGAIGRVVADRDAELLVADAGGALDRLEVAGDQVYFQADGALARVPAAGGEVLPLATEAVGAFTVAGDEVILFHQGDLLAIPLAGCAE
jgi:hypothetical protein